MLNSFTIVNIIGIIKELFFWLVPSRLSAYLSNNDEKLPPIDRYYAEKLFGSIIPFESNHKVVLVGIKGVHENYKDYIDKNFSEDMKAIYNSLYSNI